MPYTRRDFLKHGALFVALGMTAPAFLARAALASDQPVSRALRAAGLPLPAPAPNPKNALVVVQLGGGNDGLNTIVPIGDDRYYAARPTLAVPRDQVLPLVDGLGFAPGLVSLRPLYDAGQVTIVQGVGYPNPSRSHFRSMEIWQTGGLTVGDRTGWLGRYLDANCCGDDDPLRAVNIGGSLTRSLWTDHTLVPSIASVEGFRFPTTGPADDHAHQMEAFSALYGAPSADRPNEDQIRRVGREFQASAEALKAIAATYRSTVDYPKTPFAQGLRQIAQVLSADLGTRLAYVSLGGFDTHAGQAQTHARLLATLADGLAAFQRDLEGLGLAERVVTVCFSEFGRRVGENGSLGTDHGAAAPLLLLGPALRGGLVGTHPSLEDLADGDLKHAVDFRQIYATLLRYWLDADPAAVLDSDFATLPLLR